ncbi:MAG: prepilin-type N-terminal cleavage/methylation domain-containing protein [Acidimicrobiales bacterium]
MSILDRCREARSHAEADEGFTLIELLVVLLIIGILLAIAIPTFLSVTKGANGTAAQSNLQTALTGADTYYTNANQSYSGLLTSTSASHLSQIDTGLTYVSGTASSSTHTVSVQTIDSGDAVVLSNFAPGQNVCWGITDIKATLALPGWDGKTAVGTYYWVKSPATSTAGCNATLTNPTTVSSSKFPPA